MLADIPFEQRMRVEGREFRKSMLKMEIIVSALPAHKKMLLEQIDEWLLNHGIDPETIQLTPEEIEEAKKRKKEISL
ncbi:MAG: hypothetical protein II940_05680 [Methanosarcinaceae archaeon]|nr:hypothetical protein [Methanosarcinaceae archaeon]